MIDWNKTDYECEGQMNIEECLKELEEYKWQTGQYMNLPETEEQDIEKGHIEI